MRKLLLVVALSLLAVPAVAAPKKPSDLEWDLIKIMHEGLGVVTAYKSACGFDVDTLSKQMKLYLDDFDFTPAQMNEKGDAFTKSLLSVRQPASAANCPAIAKTETAIREVVVREAGQPKLGAGSPPIPEQWERLKLFTDVSGIYASEWAACKFGQTWAAADELTKYRGHFLLTDAQKQELAKIYATAASAVSNHVPEQQCADLAKTTLAIQARLKSDNEILGK